MCAKLIEEYQAAYEVFEEANRALGYDIRSLILKGNIEELTLSKNAQPAVVTAGYALYRVFEEQIGIKPFCAAGHSLGEITALVCAGAVSFSDGVVFARKRGEIMHQAMDQKKGRSGVVVDLEVSVLESIIESIQAKEYVTISGYNSPRQFVIAGTQEALKILDRELDETDGQFIPFRMIPMKADAPYHSELMSFATCELEESIRSIEFGKTNFDIWSTVTGKIIGETDSISEILCNQLVLPVRWNQVLEQIAASGVELFVDIGPQQITRNLVRENPQLPMCLSFDDEEDREKIIQYIKGGGVL
jgi:[acyl-carrier-protein] S-malonyltransferase